MTDLDIVSVIIEDYLNKKITTEVFTNYYYMFYNFIMNDEDFSDEEEQLYKALDDVVTFYDKKGLNEYPYIYDEAYVYHQTKVIYQKLNEFYSKGNCRGTQV